MSLPVSRSLAAALAILAALPLLAQGDTLLPNQKQRVSSSSKKFFIEMVPEESFGEKGSGTAYAAGKPRPLWKVDWFALRVFLASDGRHLVRLGPWAQDLEGRSDLAAAFYEEGRLLKSWRVLDLLPEPFKPERTASHYFWMDEESPIPAGFSRDERWFVLPLAEGSIALFEAATGQGARISRGDGEAWSYLTENGAFQQTGDRVQAKDLGTGKILWTFDSRFPILSPLFYNDGNLLIHNGYGELFCLEAETGKILWEAAPQPHPGPWEERITWKRPREEDE
ncbi:MAG: PQQ-binding-like beta-propeller repeat protein [Candidatus Omnitrophica bacterium]|nr:PQQ-binding-like beta-propeller repeat protein [Candidatus Omnitrophota bacterium]